MPIRSRLKLLVLLPFAPRHDASHGGGRVTAQLLTQLAVRHRVALVYLRGAGEPSVGARLQAACEFVEEIPRPGRAKWTGRARYLAGWVRGRPMWATDWNIPACSERVRAVLHFWDPDILQAQSHVMGQYFACADGRRPRRVLVEHEPGVSAALALQGPWRFVGPAVRRVEQVAWRRFERAQLKAAHAVVVFTEQDRETLASLGSNTTFTTIPLGTEIPAQPLDPIGTDPPTLLFVGNFAHPPNADAARWLVERIFPRIHACHPNSRLVLVGNAPPLDLRRRAGPNVTLAGYVPDVEPYLAQAAVVLAPLRVGGGMRVKVLEALASGKAVVASPIAVAGFDVADGEQFVVARTEQQFVDASLELICDPGKRREIGQAARSWAVAHLGWEQPVSQYEAVYQKLVADDARIG